MFQVCNCQVATSLQEAGKIHNLQQVWRFWSWNIEITTPPPKKIPKICTIFSTAGKSSSKRRLLKFLYFRGFWKCCSCQGRRPTANVRKVPNYYDLESSQEESDEDSVYSEDDMSSEEPGSESEVEDLAAVERAERAKKRELRREEKKAESKR